MQKLCSPDRFFSLLAKSFVIRIQCDAVSEIRAISEIYCQQIVPFRTRRIRLPGRKCTAEIMYTFLGYEVKAGRKRLTCPDLVTARYLKIFAELGMKQILIPYDPTRTARLIDRLERSFQRLKDSAEGEALRRLFATLRRELHQCQPAFNS